MDVKHKLEQEIDEAWEQFSRIAQEEEDDDYSDAMQSMERTGAEGYAEGLERAYRLLYDETYITKVEIHEAH